MAPEGAEDFAVAAGVRNLLLGFHEHAGVTGDLEVAVIDQGESELTLSARFFDADGRTAGDNAAIESWHALGRLIDSARTSRQLLLRAGNTLSPAALARLKTTLRSDDATGEIGAA